jgi:predicted lipoprotein
MSRTQRGFLRPWMVLLAIAAAVIVAAAFNVRVVSLEEASSAAAEGQLDAAGYAAEHYEEIAAYVDDEAHDLSTLLADLASGTDEADLGNTSGASSAFAFPVTFTAVAGTATPPTLPVTVEGVPAETTVVVQVGPALNGTALRDVSGLVSFNSFTNQLEYQEVGTELNTIVRDDVLAAFDAAAAAGKTIQVTGAFLRVNPALVSVVPTAIEVIG